jgi:3-deoxy-D-manno-octulosonate 8-phosphate phosphatase (KDO 8-P phosphatase)
VDELLHRARLVRLLVLDVDGVLTDGRLFISAQGEEFKAFHVRDGAGLVAIRKAGIVVAIISGRSSGAVDRRAAELGIAIVRQGVADKGSELASLVEELGLRSNEVACIGDDTPDLPMLAMAGLAIALADAHPQVREVAHWVTSLPGGLGAVREACDLLLRARAG